MSISGSASVRANAQRITLARLRRGMTQKALASSLGVVPRTVSRFEVEGAPAQKAPELAAVLKFPEEYFFLELTEEINTQSVQFRASRKSTKRSQNAATAIGQYAAELDSWLISRYDLPDLDLPNLEGATPNSAARELRYFWSLGDKPLPNLLQLLESKGIHCFGLPPSAQEVDAFSVWLHDRPIILISREKTPERCRFTLAHELGHLVMHQSANDKTEAEREKEANEFAAEFLMPRESIRSSLRSNPSIDEILNFRKIFGVSAMASTKAIKDAGWLSEWNHRQVLLTLSQEGYRVSEPGGMSRHEASRIFTTIFSGKFRRSTTIKDIANILSLPSEDIYWLTLETGMVSFGGGKAASNRQVASNASLRLVVDH